MNVLITHESSGVVREAFRALGHNAWSCDILPADDASPYHIQGDAIAAILSRSWDFVGMHPPCTYLTVSSIHWNDRGRGWEKTEAAMQHVRDCMAAANKSAQRWYLENSVGVISTRIRKPDQIIQPHDFGEDASKKTCLWLCGLPKLKPTKRFNGRIVTHNGKQVERWSNQTDSGQNRLGPSDTRWKERAKTYPGIAQALAQQWGAQPSDFI